jgi:hypothetical protein
MFNAIDNILYSIKSIKYEIEYSHCMEKPLEE